MTSMPAHCRVLLDTGPLIALLDRKDAQHLRAKVAFAQITPPLLSCEAVMAEACHLLRVLLGGRQAVLTLLRNGVISIPSGQGSGI